MARLPFTAAVGFIEPPELDITDASQLANIAICTTNLLDFRQAINLDAVPERCHSTI